MLTFISPSQYYVLKRLTLIKGQKIKQTVYGSKSICDHVYRLTATTRAHLASSRRLYLSCKSSRELKLRFSKAKFINFSSLGCTLNNIKNRVQKRLKNRWSSCHAEGPQLHIPCPPNLEYGTKDCVAFHSIHSWREPGLPVSLQAHKPALVFPRVV